MCDRSSCDEDGAGRFSRRRPAIILPEVVTKVIAGFLLSVVWVLTAQIATADGRVAIENGARARVAEFLESQKAGHGAEAIAELKETKAEIQDDGTSHFRFEQVHEGVPVLFSYGLVHTIKSSRAFGRVKVFRGLNGVPTTPSLTLDDAIAIAAQAMGIRWADTVRERLVIVARNSMGDIPKDNALAWSFVIGPKQGTSWTVRSHWYVINAVSGEVLLAQDATRDTSHHGVTIDM